jgi:hypothetical protein
MMLQPFSNQPKLSDFIVFTLDVVGPDIAQKKFKSVMVPMRFSFGHYTMKAHIKP